MYRFLFFLFLFISVFSCTNDFEVNAPFKDIPVVYGILSRADSNHYIRIERAFAEPGKNALELAKDPDRLYYPPSVKVELVEIRGDETERRLPMERVNAEEHGIFRADGIFVNSPNYLYLLSGSDITLNPEYSYRLEIDRGDDLPLVTAETKIVSDLILSSPNPNSNFISFDPKIPTFLSLREEPTNAEIFDFLFTVHVAEKRIDSGTTSIKSAEWLALSESPMATNVRVDGLEFFAFMAGSFEADPNIVRRIAGIDLRITAAGSELRDFREVLKANQGITGAEENIPNYSNLSEGVGLFTSGNFVEIKDLFLPANSLDSLIHNKLTRGLNFVK